MPCGAIQDLLPLFKDNVTSDESNKLVKEHLGECASCKLIYEEMDLDTESLLPHKEGSPEDGEAKLIKRIRKKKRKTSTYLITICSLLGFFLGAFIVYSNNTVLNRVTTISIEDKRNKATNSAKPVVIDSSFWKSNQVDNEEFMPGYYDIEVIEGNIRVENVRLEKGDKYLGAAFYSNNLISVKGDGTAKFTPAKFEKVQAESKEWILTNKSVIYQVGNEIPPGTYEVKVANKQDRPFSVYVGVYNQSGTQTIQSVDLRDPDSYTISIENGQLLKILNWSDNETDLSITLTKL
ncbi:zf-HC2 domain-containing protein [Radiobacillus kanasensis]|uniref:zf-HC2 domain-containing protein n=1 Tax=Radiobacillus kanasensis TaxID=2844358 RepID=UPI001E3412BC|nr:zf-HC2 domain-containing protein [Radiobacillus kanasensis]UFU01411.1 zf-HC2 domain-containing protein [Radiobacillus kanasensis]